MGRPSRKFNASRGTITTGTDSHGKLQALITPMFTSCCGKETASGNCCTSNHRVHIQHRDEPKACESKTLRGVYVEEIPLDEENCSTHSVLIRCGYACSCASSTPECVPPIRDRMECSFVFSSGKLQSLWGSLSFAVHASMRFGFVSEVDVHDTIGSPKVEIVTYRFGPRLYVSTKGRMTPFAEILAGGTRVTTSFTETFSGGRTTTSFSSNGFAFAAGGGLDVGIKPWFAWRAIQSDYSLLRIDGATSNGVRLATGIVFRFGS